MPTETSGRGIAFHAFAILAVAGCVVLCTVYPFLPGEYDALSVGLSTMAQAFGIAGLPLVAIGALWLAYERRRGRKAGSYGFASVAVIASLLVAIVVAVCAWASVGAALGLGVFAMSVVAVRRIAPALKRLKGTGSGDFHPAPLYLVCIPGAAFLVQVALADPVSEWSRHRAIANGAALIDDIEAHRVAHGTYPDALGGLFPDYKPGVVGIGQFHYARGGGAYTVWFEPPVFQLRALGTRELVAYNGLDRHVVLSHAAWNLTRPPEGLASGQGWYAVHDAGAPHWKSFRFD